MYNGRPMEVPSLMPPKRQVWAWSHLQGCDRRRYSLFYINVFKIIIIAPKASAEGACIWTEVGYCRACMLGYYELCMKGYYEEWVTVVYGSYEQVAI